MDISLDLNYFLLNLISFLKSSTGTRWQCSLLIYSKDKYYALILLFKVHVINISHFRHLVFRIVAVARKSVHEIVKTSLTFMLYK